MSGQSAYQHALQKLQLSEFDTPEAGGGRGVYRRYRSYAGRFDTTLPEGQYPLGRCFRMLQTFVHEPPRNPAVAHRRRNTQPESRLTQRRRQPHPQPARPERGCKPTKWLPKLNRVRAWALRQSLALLATPCSQSIKVFCNEQYSIRTHPIR